MKAARIVQKGVIEIVDVPTPEPREGEVLIRVEASGICGTDLHMYHGQSMGAYPVIPGHEFAGTVEAVGTGTSRIRVGDRVAVEPNLSCGNCSACLENRQHLCLNWQALGVTLPGGMAEYVTAPEYAVFPIGSLDADSGSFVEPLSCVVHGVERLAPKMGDTVALMGAGPIGLLMMRVLKNAGVSRVDVAETDAGRLKMAEAENLGDVFPSIDSLEPRKYDVVVDATGALAVEKRSISLVRDGGKVLFFGVPPEGGTFDFEPYQIFRRELTVMSSFTSLRNSLQVVRLMAEGAVKVADLVSHHFPLEHMEEAFKTILEKREPTLKVVITP